MICVGAGSDRGMAPRPATEPVLVSHRHPRVAAQPGVPTYGRLHKACRGLARTLTLVVLSVTVGMAILLGLLDFVFDRLLNGIIDLNAVAIGLTVLIVAGMFGLGFLITREE